MCYFKKLSNLLGESTCKYATSEKIEELRAKGFADDILEFFSMYDGGIEFYIWFISPFHPNWQETVDDIKQSYSYLKNSFESDNDCIPDAGEGYPFNFYPEENGILPWAQCDNGTVFYWRFYKDKITILVYGESYDFYEFDMSTTEFLYKLITKQIHCSDIDLPDDLFPDGKVQFYPNN